MTTDEAMVHATHVRSCHPYAYRSGQWARILTTVPSCGRECWLIEFDDAETDWIPIEDPTAAYEFKEETP